MIIVRPAWISAFVMNAVVLTGCITFKYPEGDWAYPVDLRLTAGILKGAVIEVRCGSGERGRPTWTESIMKGCVDTAAAVRSLGATVLADEALFPAIALKQGENSEQDLSEGSYIDVKTSKLIPDMTVVYIDQGVEKDRCIIGSLLFFMTFTPKFYNLPSKYYRSISMIVQ